MSYESYRVDQLEAAAAELNDQVDTLADALAGTECTATAEGITVTVNLEGRLTGLRLPPEATSRPPRTLAAQILQLSREAAATALAEATAALPRSLQALLAPVLLGDPADPQAHPPLGGSAVTDAPAGNRGSPTSPADADAPAHPEDAASPGRRASIDDLEDFSQLQTWSLPTDPTRPRRPTG
ncbi:YbaB/EbfC family nucleoid-associated protein [Actinophytocola xanthii]|uniref:YbaB/EbfC family DNA-binding protein n=1 Tax=Actinophytocola xanthii TaxID=1912961 RepID=A0A1Q8CR47_9PSEU|nr:YbaB/EbfC family nucleoid-associated protein [Actinophytocola xanthii]OLF16835.1 hypothetical protein BU204_14060 [Actinophytocola xanthii]